MASIDNIHIVKQEGTSCGYHRITLPFEVMGAQSKESAPIWIFNRICGLTPQQVKEKQHQGVRFIMDIDDSPFLPYNHPSYQRYSEKGTTSLMIDLVKNVNMVWCTSERLRNILFQYNPNILVIPNSIPFGYRQFTDNKIDFKNREGIIYAGECSHMEDLNIVKGMDNLTFAGYSMNSYYIDISRNFPNRNFINRLPLDNYMDLYDGMSMSIAPLQFNPFNECKSNLKTLESGCKGIPIICSGMSPYLNDMDKDLVLYANNKQEFEEKISKLKNDKVMRKELGLKLQEHIKNNYDMYKINELRKQSIESL